MDLFEGGFKIQDMIESDIRASGIDFYSSDMPRSPDTDLTSLTAATPMDITENSMDLVDGGLGWMNSSQLYNLSGDFDCIDGLVVNPQKVLSMSITERDSVQTTDSVVITSNHSLKTESSPTSALSTSSHILTVPVQVLTTTAALLNQQADSGKGHVNLTVAVPTPSPSPHHGLGQQLLTIHQVSQPSENASTESSKPKPKSKQNSKATQISSENSYPKPAYSYSCLIAMALKNSKTGSLPVNEIYDFMTENFPYFKTAPTGWKNSVRHNLSLNKCFEKIEKPSKNGTQRKGYLWAMNPAKVEKMEEELQKWGSKNLAAIKKSMANPERLELIEKGELKNADEELPSEIPVSEEREESKCNDKKGDPELRNSVESLTGEMSNSSFCALGETVNMDSSLPELDLQRGVWDNLCDDRLQFLSDSPMSSSPKQLDMLGSTIVNADEDSSSASSPSDLPKSFTHANYVYSYAESSSSSSPSPQSNGSFQLLRHSSMTPSSEKSTTCDA